MPNSLRSRIKKLAHKGLISEKDLERIDNALVKYDIPQKVAYSFDNYHKKDMPVCPVCDCFLTPTYFFTMDGSAPKEKTTWCEHCGQKLDWSDK